MNSDIKDLIERAEKAGAVYLGLSGKNHPILEVKGRKCFLPGTPHAGKRSIQNTVSQLRRMGLDI